MKPRIRQLSVNISLHSLTGNLLFQFESGERGQNYRQRYLTNIFRISLPISSRPSKSVLAKSKFYKGDQMSKPKLYAQASEKKINEIIKIKDIFSKLLSHKILEIHKVIDNSENKGKPKLNMTTRGPSCKQIIISMGSNNIKRVMA